MKSVACPVGFSSFSSKIRWAASLDLPLHAMSGSLVDSEKLLNNVKIQSN